MIHNAPLLRRESPNRRGVRSGCISQAAVVSCQQWQSGRSGNNIVVVKTLSEGAETPMESSGGGNISQGSGSKWGSPTRLRAVRIGSDPTFSLPIRRI